MPRVTRTATAPYRAPLPPPGTFGRLGDDPATIAQIISAGYDPSAPGVTYTVDDTGTVMQNITITAAAPSSGSQNAPAQAGFPWPLAAVLALIGFGLFSAGKHS